MKTLYPILLLLLLWSCSNAPATEDAPSRLGQVDFEVTGAPEALPHFEKGLLLLHSFEYEDARAAFLQAQEADAGFAMAYWGEAMTHNKGLWQRQNYEDGKAALDKLAPTAEARLAKAGTELERDFLQAVDILYGEGDKFERDKAYAQRMEELYAKYPANHEVAAFYALSLLSSVPVGRDEGVYEKGARIAEGILKENPSHPGALHYLIHSYDDPGHAHLAVQAADSYADVAPDAAHALHMPSHIYVAMGMWGEVVASNENSYAASVSRMKEKELDNDARSYHAFHWLLYGYLQQERLEDARRVMREMVQYTEETPSGGARSYLVRMKGNYLVETGDWEGEFADVETELEDLSISQQAVFAFLEGMKAYRNENSPKLKALIEEMGQKRVQAGMAVTSEGVPMCSAGSSFDKNNKADIDQAQAMEWELKALLAMLRNDDAQAERWLKEATEIQDGASYSYGPPEIVKPTYELYGEWLLEKNRPEEALEQFEKALQRGPKRRHALNGKMKAARVLGKEDLVKEVENTLEEIRRKAEGQMG